jgi:hypothetical protein
LKKKNIKRKGGDADGDVVMASAKSTAKRVRMRVRVVGAELLKSAGVLTKARKEAAAASADKKPAEAEAAMETA